MNIHEGESLKHDAEGPILDLDLIVSIPDLCRLCHFVIDIIHFLIEMP